LKSSNQTWKETTTDGVIDTTIAHQASEGVIYHETKHNPAQRRKILEHNAALRKEQPFTKKFRKDYRAMLTIPEGDFASLFAKYPDLNSTDRAIKLAAVKKLMQTHPEYVVYQRGK